MANKIQIKRSIANATVTGLSNGELAFTANGNVFYVGDPAGSGSSIRIGGEQTPGTLTANQALVANATSGIDKIIVANAAVSQLNANGATGTAGQILKSGGSGANSYWADTTASVAGTNTQVQFNDSGTLAGDADFVFYNTNNTLSVTNLIANGAGVTSVNAATVGSNTASDLRSYSDTAAGTAYSNATSYADTVAGTAYSNATSYAATIAGTAYTNAVSTAASDASSKAATAYSNATSYADTVAGTAYTNAVSTASSDASSKAATAYSNATSYADTISGTAYSNAMSDTLSRNGTYTGNNSFSGANTTVTGFLTSANADLANIKVRTSSLISGSYDRNSLDLASGDSVLLSGGNYGVNIRSANDGSSWFTLNLSPDNGALTPSANGTMNLGSSAKNFGGLWIQDVTVNGNTKLGDATSDVVSFVASVNTNIMPSANITYNLGNNTIRWNEVHAQNVHSEYLYIDKDVSISGNLYVTGNVTTINVATLSVTDSLIQLATNNTVSDLIDIGIYGNYQADGGDHEHTGLYRDATDGTWKLFVGLTEAPTSTVNSIGIGYAKGTLDSYLLSGGLVSNATNVTITANSSVAVGIVANTLSLSTALPATSGGTGTGSYTSGDLLVANTGNVLSKLTLGTSGYVLQSNGSALIYDTLDGGTF